MQLYVHEFAHGLPVFKVEIFIHSLPLSGEILWIFMVVLVRIAYYNKGTSYEW